MAFLHLPLGIGPLQLSCPLLNHLDALAIIGDAYQEALRFGSVRISRTHLRSDFGVIIAFLQRALGSEARNKVPRACKAMLVLIFAMNTNIPANDDCDNRPLEVQF